MEEKMSRKDFIKDVIKTKSSSKNIGFKIELDDDYAFTDLEKDIQDIMMGLDDYGYQKVKYNEVYICPLEESDDIVFIIIDKKLYENYLKYSDSIEKYLADVKTIEM